MRISEKVRKCLAAWSTGDAAEERLLFRFQGKINILDVINDKMREKAQTIRSCSSHSDFCLFSPEKPSVRTQSRRGWGLKSHFCFPSQHQHLRNRKDSSLNFTFLCTSPIKHNDTPTSIPVSLTSNPCT